MHPALKTLKTFFIVSDGVVADNSFLEGEATNQVFNHLRNFITAAIVAQIGRFALSMADSDPAYLARIFGTVYIASAIFLFLLNFLRGETLLKKATVKPKQLIILAYWTIYFLSALIACFLNSRDFIR